ncbi:MAG: glycerol-3-phosphate acyltransferase [Chloroflexi bacterium]|nr:glycerol-3-phosphate acyltransferase [Chloroflexota bacterium]
MERLLIAIPILLLAYLLGAVPFAYLITRALNGADIRRLGSRNVGALNVYNSVGKGPGFLVFALDASKGLLAIYIVRWLGAPEVVMYLAAVAVAVGHNWSAFLGFGGGKGAATVFGVSLAVLPWITLGVLFFTVAAVYLTGYVVPSVTAGFMLLRALGVGGFATLITSGVLDKHDVVIVSDFINRTDQEQLGATLTTAFRIDLSQSTAITVMEQITQNETLGRMRYPPDTTIDLNIAMEMAERQGSRAVVTGELGQVGNGFLVSIGLVSVPDGSTLVRLRENAADETDLLATIDRISNNLRMEIGESIRYLRAEKPLEEITTSSLEALRLVTESIKFEERFDFPPMLALLEQAIELDSTFAMAYQRMGGAHLNMRNLEQAKTAIVNAYKHRDHLPRRELLLASALYFSFIEEDNEKAISAYQTVLDHFPYDIIALNNLANEFSDQDRLEEADVLYRRLVEVTNYCFWNLATSQITLGRFDEFDKILTQWNEEQPDHPNQMRARRFAYIAQRDLDAAFSGCNSISGASIPRLSEECTMVLAKIAVSRGQISAYKQYIDELTSQQTALGNRGAGLRLGLMAIADIFGVTGNRELAEVELSELLTEFLITELVAEASPWTTLAALYFDLGDSEAAEDALSNAVAPLDDIERIVSKSFQDARLILSKDGLAAGILALERANNDKPKCRGCGLDYLGAAYEASGRIDDAIAAYEQFLSLTSIYVSSWLPRDTAVLFRLGELYEDTGDQVKAIEKYTLFAERWKDADEELQPRVAEAHRRIEALLDQQTREPAN